MGNVKELDIVLPAGGESPPLQGVRGAWLRACRDLVSALVLALVQGFLVETGQNYLPALALLSREQAGLKTE